MTDKPIAAKIILTLAQDKVPVEHFIGLSGTLYRQNLIFCEPRELRLNKNKLELTVIFRDNTSFKNWTKNIEIKKGWSDKFEKLLVEKPKIIKEQNAFIEIDNIKNCNCKNSNFYILEGRKLPFNDELTCGNCLRQISYSKFPLEIKLEEWQTKHERFYQTWLEGGLFEKEALKELLNYKKGKLNLAGEDIRQQISNHFEVPVYISYFVENPDDKHSCVICEQKGVESGLKRPGRICKTCNTIYG